MRDKSGEEYALEEKWRDRLMQGAPAADFSAAYDQVHEHLVSRSGDEPVYGAGGQVRVDWARRAIVSRIPPGSRVLDIGGGEGALAAMLAAEGSRVTSVDVSSVIIARAQRDAGRAASILFGQADARALPFADGAFGYVVSEDLVEHLPPGDLVRHLTEARRMINGGCYIISTPSRLATGRRSVGFHLRMYTLGELAGAMRSAGFRVTWMDPRFLRRLGRRVEIGGAGLWLVCAVESLLDRLGIMRWPARWRARLAPKPLVCGYAA